MDKPAVDMGQNVGFLGHLNFPMDGAALEQQEGGRDQRKEQNGKEMG